MRVFYEFFGGDIADGFEDALIGYVERCGTSALACYDTEKCIDILINRDGMTHEEAWDYFSYNTLGAYIDENTPIFLIVKIIRKLYTFTDHLLLIILFYIKIFLV